MFELDPYSLDRRLATMARSWRGFRRALGEGTASEHRFEIDGRFATLELLSELEQAPPGVFAVAQRRWLLRFHEQHQHLALLARREQVFRRQLETISEPELGQLPLERVLASALAEPARRKSWLRSLTEHGSRVAAERLVVWQQRAELRERIGFDRFDALWLPGKPALAAATAVLERTREAYLEHAAGDLSGLLEAALATGAGGSYPLHLSTRSLIELLDAARWFEGLPFELEALPAPLAPTSFARGLAAVGAAFTRAVKSDLPAFAATHDAFGLGEHAHAALFAALPLLPAFAQRQLEVPRHALGDFRRRMAVAALVSARATALRTLLVEPALRGGSAFHDAFSESFNRAFAFEIDPRLAGVLFTPRFDQAQRLAGLLLAAERGRDLVERHDDDWFRNPRAREELRETARLPDPTSLSDEDVERGLTALQRA
jgi:hypothetical protein